MPARVPKNAEKITPGLAKESRKPLVERPLRPDAQRNAARVLAAARQAFATTGLNASYHDIARLAKVGVGTVYRRFPDAAQLREAVLLDILHELTAGAEQALARADAWPAFAEYFTVLALRTREHAGLSESVDERGGRRVAAARQQFIGRLRALTERTQHAGVLRPDLTWRDLPFLARVAAFGDCALDIPGGEPQAQRCIVVVLDGMRAPAASPLVSLPSDGR